MANELQLSSYQRMHESPSANDAQRMAELILGSYPNAAPHDGATYTRVLRETLLKLPAVVARAVANPRSGIVTRCKWLPTVAEIEEFAEPMKRELQRQLDRDRLALEPPSKDNRTPEEIAYVANGLRELSRNMARTLAEKQLALGKPGKPVRFPQCEPGEAIRGYMPPHRKEPAQ